MVYASYYLTNLKRSIMKKNVWVIMLLLLTTLLGVSCGVAPKEEKTDPAAQISVTGQDWVLFTLKGKQIDRANRKVPFFNLSTAENKVSGFAGCNRFFGTYRFQEESQVEFSEMGSTRMACPDNDFNENEFLQVLEGATGYHLDGENLVLTDSTGKNLAVFTAGAEGKTTIEEKYWKLVTIDGGEVKMGENQQKEPHFILRANTHQVSGHTGCNGFGGTYTLKDGHQIEFSRMISTLRACMDMPLKEGDFLKVFRELDHYEVDGDHLTFKNKAGEEIAAFEAVYF